MLVLSTTDRSSQVPLMRDPATRLDHCTNCDSCYSNGRLVSSASTTAPSGDAPNSRERPPMAAASPQEPAGDGPSPSAATPLPELSREANGVTQSTATATGQGAGASTRAAARASAAVPSDSDRAAQLLSDRMLQGWALLDISCPR